MFRYLRRSRTISAVQAILDSYFGYTSLLLNGETTQTPFTSDASANNMQVAPVGSVRNDTFSPFDAGYYSTLFNGSTDCITLPANSSYAVGTGDFTIEAWVLLTASAGGTIFDTMVSTVAGNSNRLAFGVGASSIGLYSGSAIYTSTSGLSVGVWTHVALTRQSSVIAGWINGVKVGTVSNSYNFSDNNLTIGCSGKSGAFGSWFPGYISNLRFVKGTAVYTAAFTPSSLPLKAVSGTSVLVLQDSLFKDNSTLGAVVSVGSGTPKVSPKSPFAYTQSAGSGYFNGTSDYLTFPATSAISFGTNNYTVEFWVLPAWGSNSHVMDLGNGFEIKVQNNSFNYSGLTTSSGNIPPANQWSHCAIVRTGTTAVWYLNGVSVSSGIDSYNYTATGTSYIGNFTSGSYYYAGYISNLRIVNGTAVYTGNFTPPTAPLTAITNTVLLTCQNSGPPNNIGFIDSSANDLAIVASGAPTQGTFSPFSQTGWSAYFNGSTDYLTIPGNTVMNVGSANWTVEAWVNLNAMPTSDAWPANWSSLMVVVGTGTPSLGDGFDALIGATKLSIQFNETQFSSSSVHGLTIGVWNHIAYVRNGNVVSFYVNGVLNGTVAVTVAAGTGSNTYIGSETGQGAYFNGLMSNLRVVNGTAVYTAAFTPSTSPLTAVTGTKLLTLQGNRFKDNSTSPVVLTPSGSVAIQAVSPFEPATSWSYSANGGSMYLNGTTDWFTTAAVTALGSGNWTMETWVNPASFSAAPNLIDFRTSSQGLYPNIGITTSGYPYLYVSAAFVLTSTVAVTLNAWSHIAFSKNGSVTTVYVNGVSGGTYADTNTYLSSTGLTIGSSGFTGDSHGFKLTGYISGLRIVLGTAIYTAAFTTPTTPVTAVANTQLLLNGTNSGIANAASANDISTFGTASTSVAQKKFGSKSLYFNGTTDYLTAPVSSAFKFAGDFTVEAWIYLTVANASNVIYDSRTTSTSTTGFVVSINASKQLLMYTGLTQYISYQTVALSTWTHVAYVRKGSANMLYINGVACAALNSSTTNYTDGNCVIGKTNESLSNLFTGYIDDLRITNGVARYTNGFTIPTTAYGDSTANDPYFNYVSLLVHADGTTYMAPAFNNNMIVDSSYNALTISRTGNPTQGTFSPFGGNGWSVYFNGTNDWAQVSINSALDLGAGNFTVEFWFNTPVAFTSGVSGSGFLGKKYSDSTNGWQIYRDSNTPTKMNARLGLTNNFFSATTPKVGVWQHWALVRSGTAVSWYVNGVLDATTTNSVNLADTSASFNVGFADTWSAYGNFGISNLRIVKGTAVYTANFTPSTQPLTAITGTQLLAFQNNRFVDNSTNALTVLSHSGAPAIQATSPFAANVYSAAVNGGSLYFNGSTDLISASTATNFGLGTVFTVEAWVYPTSFAVTNGPMIMDNRTTNECGYWGISTAGIMGTTVTSSSVLLTSTVALVLNAWSHVALASDASGMRMYINGAIVATTATQASWPATTRPYFVGSAFDTSQKFSGYISNARVVKGTSVYTTAFTPPTAPLAITGNTTLLLSGVGSGIVDGTGKNDVVTVGTSKTQSAVVKYGTGAMSFNGTSDYLASPSGNFMAFGTGDFTVEFWVYPTALSATNGPILIDNRPTGTNGAYFCIPCVARVPGTYVNNANQLVSNTALALNVWTHLAVVRSNSVITMYLNGTSVASMSDTNSYLSSNQAVIGAASGTLGVQPLSGYIDDLRVTKGYARYTAAFTPPTAALPNSSTGDAYFQYNSLLLQGDIQQVSTSSATNNVFIDSSANALALTVAGNPTQGTFSPFSNDGWSTYFNGTTDYLTAGTTASDFMCSGTTTITATIEAWINPTSIAATGGNLWNCSSFMSKGLISATTCYWNFGLTNLSGVYSLRFYWWGGGALYSAVTSTTQIQLGVWSHVAVVIRSSTVTLYINGVASGSGAYTNPISVAGTGGTEYLGIEGGTSYKFNGLTSNARITNTAVYTSNFNVPVAPFTAITGTQLLTLQDSRFKDNSSNAFALTTTGSPAIAAKSPFAVSAYNAATNGASIFFNGTTDTIGFASTTPVTSNNVGTIEMWFLWNGTSTGVEGNPLLSQPKTSSGGEQAIYVGSDGSVYYSRNSFSSYVLGSAVGLALKNTWNHIAVVFNGASGTYLYLNGNRVATNATPTGWINTTQAFQIGYEYVGSYPSTLTFFGGYISNLRIVCSTALYTGATYTVPTAPLTAITNTQLLLNGTAGAVTDTSGTSDVILMGSTHVNSSNKIGSGALVFNGTTDYAYIQHNPSYVFGNSNFTIECWFNATSQPAAAGIISKVLPAAGNYGPFAIVATTAALALYMSSNGSGWDIVSGGAIATALSINTWYHVAVVRNGNVITAFFNGVPTLVINTTAALYANTSPILIGADNGASVYQFFQGQIDEVRITMGVARYGNFAVPTAAFPTN